MRVREGFLMVGGRGRGGGVGCTRGVVREGGLWGWRGGWWVGRSV